MTTPAPVPAAAPAHEEPSYGGFWIRFLAVFLDGAVLALPIGWAAWRAQYHPMTWTLRAAMLLLPAVYVIGFWGWKGATPGKMAVGLRIRAAATGEQIGWGRSVGRYFARAASSIPLGLGYAWVGWDPRKQGFHDHIAGTVVVREGEPPVPVGVTAGLFAAGIVVLIVGGGVLGAAWFASHASQLRAQGDAVKKEAADFAPGKDAARCRDEGFRRLDACDGIVCESLARLFYEDCLKDLPAGAVDCSGVPRADAILATAAWTNLSCASLSRSTPSCRRFIQAVPRACADLAKAAAPAAPAPASAPVPAP